MLVFPKINPVAFSIGPLQVHWYGLTYLVGFLGAWLLGRWRVRRYQLSWTAEQLSDLIFYGAVGAIVGGRLGYMLFYSNGEWLSDPLSVLMIWQGGMSFHGGLLGVLMACWLFCRKTKKTYLEVSDFLAPLAPLGLGAGRIGNFINGELWGRVTDVPWAMIFPNSDGLPRHPSQLYEFGLEGVGLFTLMWWYTAKPRSEGCTTAVFLVGYAISRFIIEFFRQPDQQIGFIAFHWLTMGQLLTIPMLVIGILLWWNKRCKPI